MLRVVHCLSRQEDARAFVSWLSSSIDCQKQSIRVPSPTAAAAAAVLCWCEQPKQRLQQQDSCTEPACIGDGQVAGSAEKGHDVLPNATCCTSSHHNTICLHWTGKRRLRSGASAKDARSPDVWGKFFSCIECAAAAETGLSKPPAER